MDEGEKCESFAAASYIFLRLCLEHRQGFSFEIILCTHQLQNYVNVWSLTLSPISPPVKFMRFNLLLLTSNQCDFNGPVL